MEGAADLEPTETDPLYSLKICDLNRIPQRAFVSGPA